ncbi:HEAT repeat domain-containing protein, partial [Candidatus Binatia bacterium]|nr:HEAT repeat domain-containing protein [Candidatus Binatia bacterium]
MATLAVVAITVALAAPGVAGTPYDLDAGHDVERAARPQSVERDVAGAGVVERAGAQGGSGLDAANAAELAQALQQLHAAEWIDRLTGLYALQRMGGAAIAPVVAQVAPLLADENGSVREEAAECLFRADAPAVPPLVDALSSRDDDTRALAARTLGRIGLGARAAVPALESMRDDASPDVADQVAFALPMIAPQGPRDWLWKIGFEIEDEPWGIPIVFGVFVALVLGKQVWNLWRRSRERETPAPGA